MYRNMKIQKWQLLRWKSREEIADLRDRDFVAVGKKAFRGQWRLEEVYLPSNTSAIKTGAFRGCRRLGGVEFSHETNTGLANKAFENCVRLSRAEPSELLSVIGARAFANCRSLKQITFGREMRRIGEEAFRGCNALTEIKLPASLTEIGTAAFADCTELATVETEDGLPRLAPDLFRGCFSLRSVTFASTLSEIPAGAFRGCSALTELTIPAQIGRVGKNAFLGCARLERVYLEHGVSRIGKTAFADTPRLREITVPSSLKTLGFGAFGLGKCEEKAVMYVENEYMLRRMKRLLFLCGSWGRVRVELIGKSIEERKRERHRATLEQTPVHIMDTEEPHFGPDASDEMQAEPAQSECAAPSSVPQPDTPSETEPCTSNEE